MPLICRFGRGGLPAGCGRRIAPRALAPLVLFALACGPAPDPYCTEYDDGTGRAFALCRTEGQHAVCDARGDSARFERDGSGVLHLVGGTYAFCDEARQVVCPDRSENPRCLVEPD